MTTSRLADRQIRAAQQAVRGLDVRGPVSRALGQTGIVVPADDAPLASVASESAPERKPAVRAYPAAPRVLKPFAETPWPTRKPAPAEPARLTGLTADERRVHRILIDTLDVTTEQTSRLGGLSFGDRARLEALDLAFIDAQMTAAKRRGTVDVRRVTILTTTALAGLLLWLGLSGRLAASGFAIASAASLLIVAAAVSFGLIPTAEGGGSTQRLRILRALRELAILAHADDATSDALAQADALIDRLADADQAPAPLLDLPRHSDADAPAARQRVRS